MAWTKPEFTEINLSGEVTAYSNTDGEVRAGEADLARREPLAAAHDQSPRASA